MIGGTYNTTKKLHPWVIRDYRPHSRFVVVKPEYVNEIKARLLLLGYKKALTKNSITGERSIVDKYDNGVERALFMDGHNEWILTRNALEDLEVW